MLHSPPVFLLVEQVALCRHEAGCLTQQGQHLVLPSPVLEKQLATRHQHASTCQHQVELEAPKAKLVCATCLCVYVRAVQTHGARHETQTASAGSLHILLRTSSSTEVRHLQFRLSTKSAMEQTLHSRKTSSATDSGLDSSPSQNREAWKQPHLALAGKILYKKLPDMFSKH